MKAKKTKTQVEAVKDMLIQGMLVTGSNAFQYTKKVCKQGSLNLHKQLFWLRKRGYVIHEYWADGHTHKVFMLDKKKTPKQLLKTK